MKTIHAPLHVLHDSVRSGPPTVPAQNGGCAVGGIGNNMAGVPAAFVGP